MTGHYRRLRLNHAQVLPLHRRHDHHLGHIRGHRLGERHCERGGGTNAQSIGLTAPSDAGTYYYGACVDSVTGESVTNNNCSSGLKVIVVAEAAPDLYITALVMSSNRCKNG